VSDSDFKREITTTILLVLFLLHPAITRYASSLFYCIELDDGEFWLYRDLDIRCWTGKHLIWACAIGIPMLLVWVMGAPIAGFVVLYKNRHRLKDPMFFAKYRMIYQGFKHQFFYWEVVNTLRKTFLVITNVFLNMFD